ncbi:MAG: hypothetical protein NT074_04145 [Methanomicrobiales archaeon]|jgi:hypothetical protein|nr:hypothetical protein [Methanomicrobiales archaeon]
MNGELPTIPSSLVTLSVGILFLALLLTAGCTQPYQEHPKEQGVVSGTGTIRYIDLEGGFFGIVADSGVQYYPLELPAHYQSDGARVMFVVKIRDDIVTVQQWGTPVEVREMAPL